MPRADGEEERLAEERLPSHRCCCARRGQRGLGRATGQDRQVDPPLVEDREICAAGDEGEGHVRMGHPELPHQGRHQPRAESLLVGERDRPAVGVHELIDVGQGVVQSVDDGVDMLLEHRTRMGEPQHAAGLDEQRRPDLTLQRHEVPGHLRLAHHPEVGDLGHGGPVSHLLKPSQHLGLHDS